MRSLQLLRDTASKQRAKADDLRKQSEKQRSKAQDYPDDPASAQRYATEAQRYDQQAALIDQEVAGLEVEATALEAQLADIERRKNEAMATMQTEIDRLDAEARTIRG